MAPHDIYFRIQEDDVITRSITNLNPSFYKGAYPLQVSKDLRLQPLSIQATNHETILKKTMPGSGLQKFSSDLPFGGLGAWVFLKSSGGNSPMWPGLRIITGKRVCLGFASVDRPLEELGPCSRAGWPGLRQA